MKLTLSHNDDDVVCWLGWALLGVPLGLEGGFGGVLDHLLRKYFFRKPEQGNPSREPEQGTRAGNSSRKLRPHADNPLR